MYAISAGSRWKKLPPFLPSFHFELFPRARSMAISACPVAIQPDRQGHYLTKNSTGGRVSPFFQAGKGSPGSVSHGLHETSNWNVSSRGVFSRRGNRLHWYQAMLVFNYFGGMLIWISDFSFSLSLFFLYVISNSFPLPGLWLRYWSTAAVRLVTIQRIQVISTYHFKENTLRTDGRPNNH